jgi:hypothetical protein
MSLRQIALYGKGGIGALLEDGGVDVSRTPHATNFYFGFAGMEIYRSNFCTMGCTNLTILNNHDCAPG